MENREPIRQVDPTEIVEGPDWTMPLSLRFIAFLFILFGALAVTEMALRLFAFGNVHIDPAGIAFVLIGWGLLHWRNAARLGAAIVFWILIASAMMIVLTTLYRFTVASHIPYEVGIGAWRGGPGGAIVIAIAIGLFAFWQLHILNRSDIVWRFKNRPLAKMVEGNVFSRPVRRWRFSLSTLFLLMTITAFVLLRLTSDTVLYDTRHLSDAWSKEGQWHSIEFGVRRSRLLNRPEELLYVVLSNDDHWSGSGHVTQTPGNRLPRTGIKSPDGTQIGLPSQVQLYEFVGENVRTRDERVSKAELDDFITSRPPDWTLDSLIKHAEQMRAKVEKASQP